MNKRLPLGLGFVLLVLPCSLLVAFTHYPAVRAFINSLWNNASSRRPSRFVGFENYEAMIADDKLMQVLTNSGLYALGTIPLAIFLSISMALLVNSKFPATGLMRLSFFLPTMLPLVAVANIWLFFYAPGIGLASQMMNAIGLPTVNFLGSTETSLVSMMVVAVWKEAGLFMIFYLAALQAVPENLKDAARLEGAGPVRVFFDVIFPLLRPTTIFVAVNALINAFRLVDHIIVMTRGGPDNSSALLLFYIYEVTFRQRDFAYGATLTVLMVAILGVLAAFQFWVLDRKTHYQ
ncbi:carbohydrate ABC transporter membrane protein 1, CUT1 family [Jannaschia faecimaris]|uniref:Carbohydrate ABC transporter membrane protein 1, CUT1 family n=1 Tax=Jannaschia faecimaris TaxID=1244108 RepID=A0A1H3U1Y4_9RHOB|nr:sugar ABC transporter permease [Jannaschia faecimaris]SDZ56466.1 carbohydrate ABC transporter membrane protein 1, CUT1 family [Jannaschia faecimaris]